MSTPNAKIIGGAAALVSAAALAVGGATWAQADAPSAGATAYGYGAPAGDAGGPGPRGGRGGHAHTAVTGAEATKVTAAVTAKDSTIKVTGVQKDPDGSYDVLGTKDNAQVMVEVSADLTTVEIRTGGPGPRGGRGGHAHTAVTGAEATKVTAAVTAKDSTIKVTGVQKDPDGSFDVLGTKDNAQVMVEVSADLTTVEIRTGGHGPGAGRVGDMRGDGVPGATSPTAVPSAASGASV